jgi:hypothetical protein
VLNGCAIDGLSRLYWYSPNFSGHSGLGIRQVLRIWPTKLPYFFGPLRRPARNSLYASPIPHASSAEIRESREPLIEFLCISRHLEARLLPVSFSDL